MALLIFHSSCIGYVLSLARMGLFHGTFKLRQNVTLLSLLICGVLMILMMRNVRRKQVFIQQNANLIAGIGFSLEVNGLVLITLHYLSPASSDGSQQYLIFMLIGVFFLFINCLFKLGIQMQEEQDLTV